MASVSTRSASAAGHPRSSGQTLRQPRDGHPGIGQELQRGAANAVLVEVNAVPGCLRGRQRQPEKPLPPLSQLVLRSAEDLSPPRADAAERQPLRRQPLVGVVDPQAEPVLGARGEHPIGLADAARDEVVDEHADVGFGAVEGDAVGPGGEARRIEPGDKPLRRRFLVAGRAVDLAGQEEARKALRLERRRELARIDVVVLDRIARPQHGGASRGPGCVCSIARCTSSGSEVEMPFG